MVAVARGWSAKQSFTLAQGWRPPQPDDDIDISDSATIAESDNLRSSHQEFPRCAPVARSTQSALKATLNTKASFSSILC